MSSVDGYSAFFASAAESSAAAIDLTLGIPPELLGTQVRVGDLLAALVLPPQNGQDLLEILGQTIAAHLPPTVRPGEQLLVQVAQINPNQIVVRNLGPADPSKPLPPEVVQNAVAERPAPSPSPAPASAPAAASPVPPRPGAQLPNAQPSPVAPSRAVFVAASVVRAQPPVQTGRPAPSAAAHVPAVEARINAARAAAAQKPAPTPPVVRAPLLPSRGLPPQTGVPVRAAAAARAGTPEHLLQAVRIAHTPAALAAARVASDAVRRLPEVLARLERALAPVTGDARTATLRTLSAFVARIDPRNEETLPHQIASYVSHVLDGAEKKIVSLVRAHRESAEPPIVSQAKVFERSAALEHNAKALVLSLLSRPPAQHTPELARALRDAVTAFDGAQLQTLAQQTQTPDAISFALPVFFHDGGQPAQLTVRRERENAKAPLDGDNFHVAFVLDTSALGTVSIELQSSGRSVSVNVRTENERYVPAFKATLADLVVRLEKLRYRVSRTAAQALARAPGVPAAPAKQPERRPAGWDMRA